MNKKSVIGIIVGLLLLAYPIATWWTGKQVAASLAKQYQTLEGVPFVKVLKRDYQSGLANSTETVTFELFGDMFRSIEKAQKESAAAGANTAPTEPVKPLQFTLRNHIKHGPFAGGGVAAAVVDSELVFDAKTQQEIAKVLGDKKPLAVRTVFNFAGGGRSEVSSPAFATTVPDAAGTSGKLAWEGFKANVDFASGMKSYSMRGEAPKLEVQDAKGVHMLMTGLQLEGQQQRIFDDEPLLYSGTQKFTVAQLNISGAGEAAEESATGAAPKPVVVKNVVYDINMPVTGDFIDMAAKLGAASVVVDKQEYGPARYEFSLKHLHARTIAKLYRAMMQMYSNPAMMSKNTDPTKAMDALAEPAMELLKHNPELRIDRISFNSPHGEAAVSAHARLNGAKPEDFANPMMMIAKLDAGADLALPESMLAELGAAKAQTVEEKQMQQQMFAAQLEAFAEQGYVTRARGLLKSKIAFQNGQLTVNGKPFNPMAMGGGEAGVQAPGGEEAALGAGLPELEAENR